MKPILLFVLSLISILPSVLCNELDFETNNNLNVGDDFTLLDYEVEALEPWKQALEGQESRETLPSLRRVERSSLPETFPMAASKTRARRNTGLIINPRIQQRISLHTVGRYGHDSYNGTHDGDKNGDMSHEQELSEAEQKFEDMNEQIFMFPASYLIPETLSQPYCLHKAGLWNHDVESVLKACSKSGDMWKCLYMKMGRPSANEKFSLSHLTKWLNSASSGPHSLRKKLSTAPNACTDFWQKYLHEEQRRLFWSELELEVEHRTAELNGPRWRRNKDWNDEEWAEISKIRRLKWQERLKRREKSKRLKDLKSKQTTLTPAERKEMMELNTRISELGERERESVIGQNLEREDRVLMDEELMLAQCIRQRVLEACDELLLLAVRESLL